MHDAGTGVAEQDAERIFERFTRGSRRTTDGGAGLGLSIVRVIAEAHGGTVRLIPGAGPGARLEIEIPATKLAERGTTSAE